LVEWEGSGEDGRDREELVRIPHGTRTIEILDSAKRGEVPLWRHCHGLLDT